MKTFKFEPLAAGLLLAFFFTCQSCVQSDEIDASEIQQEEIVDPVYDVGNDGSVTLRTDCDGDDIHWEYEGADGPDEWADLCDGWACGGYSQSPVNIIAPPTSSSSKLLTFQWKPSGTRIVNNGHTIQFNYDGGSTLKMQGGTYQLLQFHFHAASEHTVGGKHARAEVHFVHQNMATGKLAVVGVFIDTVGVKDASPFFDKFLEHLPHHGGQSYNDAGNLFHAQMLMPDSYNAWGKQRFWYYQGSLTTPPCSEIVSWIVMKDRVKVSSAQMHELEELLHENYRPAQPLFSRVLQSHGPILPLVNW